MTAGPAEVAAKLERVRAVMGRRGLDAVVLRGTAGVAWLSGGGRTHVLLAQEVGVADVVVTPETLRIVTVANEVDRLVAEELTPLVELGAEVEVLPWSADRASVLPTGPRTGWDVGAPSGTVDAGLDLKRCRWPLLPEEVSRARGAAADVAAALGRVMRELTPRHTERAAAARAAAAMHEVGADPVVLLVAGARRLPYARHPLPTAEPLGSRAMLVLSVRRAGLFVSLTRMVSFGALPSEDADAFGRLLQVDAAFNAATVPGRRIGDVFAVGADAYAANGFAADEYTRHHQGGPGSYDSRDVIATRDTADEVVHDQLFAWNPSVPGLKSEDTVLSREGGPPEVLTVDPDWPTQEVDGLLRPVVLEP